MIAADLRRFGALVIAPIVAVLAACTPAASEPAPTPTPSPSPSQTPFAEKNAAAIEAYKRYEEMVQETGTMGGYATDDDAPPSVAATTMGEERAAINKINRTINERQLRPTGQVRLVRVALVSSHPMPGAPGGHEIKVVACRDNREVKIASPEGARSAPEPFQEIRATLYHDSARPAGWKVAVHRGEEVKSC